MVFCLLDACFFFGVYPRDATEFEEPVENVFEEQSYFPTEEIPGKMIIPWISLLSLLC